MLSTEDDQMYETPSDLVLGMGVGVFIIFLFTIILFLVWLFSSYCRPADKVLWRMWSVLIFTTIMLILIFSERETKYYYGGYSREIYDYSIVPRIAIASVLMWFVYHGVKWVILESGESRELSSTDSEFNSLWQD
jgi:hypothetical protein